MISMSMFFVFVALLLFCCFVLREKKIIFEGYGQWIGVESGGGREGREKGDAYTHAVQKSVRVDIDFTLFSAPSSCFLSRHHWFTPDDMV